MENDALRETLINLEPVGWDRQMLYREDTTAQADEGLRHLLVLMAY